MISENREAQLFTNAGTLTTGHRAAKAFFYTQCIDVCLSLHELNMYIYVCMHVLIKAKRTVIIKLCTLHYVLDNAVFYW